MALTERNIIFNSFDYSKSGDQSYRSLNRKSFKYFDDTSQKEYETISRWHQYGHLFEADIGNFLVRIIKKEDRCVDVGANVGMHALLMASLANKGSVICFEPNEICFKTLKKNIKLNNFTNIKLKKKLIGEHLGEDSYFHASDNDWGTSYALKKIEKETLNWEKLKTYTLDTELKNEKRIKIIKIDVEGFEGKVLRGSKELLKNDCVRYWIVEYAPHCLKRNNDSLDTIRNLTERHGLEMYILDPSGGLPKFIPNRIQLQTHWIPNLLFTKTKHLNEDWIIEDTQSLCQPRNLWPY